MARYRRGPFGSVDRRFRGSIPEVENLRSRRAQLTILLAAHVRTVEFDGLDSVNVMNIGFRDHARGPYFAND